MSRPTDSGKARAKLTVRDAMLRKGFDNRHLAVAAGVDEGTVGEFMNNPQRWLALRTQGRLEEALGLPAGTPDNVARELPVNMPSGNGKTSDPADTVSVVDLGVDRTGRQMIVIKAAAIGLEVQTTYATEAERSRFLDEVLGRLHVIGGDSAEHPDRDEPRG